MDSRVGAASGRSWTHEHVLLGVLTVTLAACCWLISAGPGVEEGHQPWRTGSVLRVLTNLMALDFQYPTSRGTEIKWLIQGLGAAAALLVGAAAWYANTRQDAEETDELSPLPGAGQGDSGSRRGPSLTPAGVAQLALVVFAAWAMLSARWAPWPEVAFGEGVRQLIMTIWAIALGQTLSRRGARKAAAALAAVLAITAVLGIWYRLERNPYQRLKFPIGNPIFLAACLLPGITLSVSGLLAALSGLLRGCVRSGTAIRAATVRERFPPVRADRFLTGAALKRLLTHRAAGAPAGAWAGAGWLAIGSALGLIALCWAFKLTDSRGPQIGLIVGFVVAACVWATGRLRRGLLLAILVSVIVAAGYLSLFGWPDFVTRRLDTVTLRFYSWSYAIHLFLGQPFVGRGQAAYMLLAQSLSSPHAEYAPSVFPGHLMGHAHNEWLEILADLGAVGFALMMVGLGATFWAAAVAMRHARGEGMGRATVFGLLAAFVGIVVSEATGVALRMPGLPVIFYTVIGLIWASARDDDTPASCVARYGRSVRLAVLSGAVVVSVVIGTLVLWDWQGALADRAVTTHTLKYRWDEALRQAQIAKRWRLVVEGRLSAENQYNFVAYRAAAHRFQQLRDMMSRLEDPGRPSAHTLQLAREDSAVFNAYAQRCIESGQQLLSRMPHYPYVAGRVASVWLLKQQMEAAERQLGLRQEVHSYVPTAREWLRAEYQRDRLDPHASLRLFQLSGDQPLTEQLDLLRLPLRRGPWIRADGPGEESQGKLALDLFGEFELALAALAQKPGYPQWMDTRVAQARTCLTLPEVAAWPDRYAPETLRLAARAKKLNRRFTEAVSLTSDAVRLSEKLVRRFPELVSYALIDQSRYLLLAHPDEPERAVAACRQAIARWPASGDRKRGAALRRSLALYLLAAGNEPEARQCLATLEPRLSGRDLDRLIGYGLGELCQKMGAAFGPTRRPRWFNDRLQRYLELVPDWADGRFFAAYVAFEVGDAETGFAHLEAMAPLMDEPSQMARIVLSLLQRFPENQALHTFARTRFGFVPSSTQPAATAPTATGPMS